MNQDEEAFILELLDDPIKFCSVLQIVTKGIDGEANIVELVPTSEQVAIIQALLCKVSTFILKPRQIGATTIILAFLFWLAFTASTPLVIVLMALNEKQEKFAQNYILHRNATEAAKSAGYSSESAYNQGYRLLQSEEIKERIYELEQELETNVDVVSELEQQYTFAKNNGHTNSAIKALELLSRVRGAKSENNIDISEEGIEANIIECLKILGKKKVNELIKKCDFTLPLKLNKEQHQQHQEKTKQEHQE